MSYITDYKRKTDPEIQGYKNLHPSEYTNEMQEAVKLFYGYVEFDELAEALMVSANSLTYAARWFGVLDPHYEHVEAPEIERAMRLIKQGTSTNKIAYLYGIGYNPDRKFFKSQYQGLNSKTQEGLF